MPRVPVHTLDSAPEAAKDNLRALTERVGKTLNIFGEMAHAPVVLDSYVELEDRLSSQSSLDQRTRAAMHLTVANVNQCDYCQAAYTGQAKASGFSDEDALAIRGGDLDTDARLQAVIAVAREIAANKGYVDDATWAAALDAGWTDAQLLEVFIEVVRTIFTNYFNHLVGTELDLPAAPDLP
ncbi:MAG: carboxymuconolactone decarboxylase family protein [Acidimicrobiales bacterium]|nr:carboxymuconolactone decarboxylase family protein [Acidimicrobiales bacterium]